MANNDKTTLETLQDQLVDIAVTVRDTNRAAFRGYLDLAFRLQRTGLEALGLVQQEMERATITLVNRTEELQDKTVSDAQLRLTNSIETGRETLTANVERLREVRDRGLENWQDNRERINELVDSTLDNLRDTLESLRENAGTLQSRLGVDTDELSEAGTLTENRIREAAEIALKVAKVLENRLEAVIGEIMEMGRREWGEIEQRVESLVDRLDAELDEEINPIASYDDKTVEEIVGELRELDTVQLRAIRGHEAMNKNRVTILRAIDEKLALNGPSLIERVEKGIEQAEATITNGALPIKNYDDKNVEEVVAALRNVQEMMELTAVRVYEVATKNRITVLRAIDERMEEMRVTQ